MHPSLVMSIVHRLEDWEGLDNQTKLSLQKIEQCRSLTMVFGVAIIVGPPVAKPNRKLSFIIEVTWRQNGGRISQTTMRVSLGPFFWLLMAEDGWGWVILDLNTENGNRRLYQYEQKYKEANNPFETRKKKTAIIFNWDISTLYPNPNPSATKIIT